MTASARAASTRRQLLDAARDAFEEGGYRGTTVADIVDRASTARGTFYLYFRNKEDVFAQLVAEAIEDLRRETAMPWASGDRAEAVREATRNYLHAFARRRRLWRAVLEAFGAHRDVERQWLELRARFHERIARNLERGLAEGVVRPDLDPLLTAEALGAMTEWLAYVEYVVRDRPDEGERFDRLVDTLTALWVLGTTVPH
jgi:AcrR family transcriptional regulator